MSVEGLRGAVAELVGSLGPVAKAMSGLAITLAEAATSQPASLPMYAKEIIASVGPTHADRVAWARHRAYEGLKREMVIVLLFAPLGSWDLAAWELLRGYVPDSDLEAWLLSSDAAGKNAAFFAARLLLLGYKRPLPQRTATELLATSHALTVFEARLEAQGLVLTWAHPIPDKGAVDFYFSLYLKGFATSPLASGHQDRRCPEAPPRFDVEGGAWARPMGADGGPVDQWRKFCAVARSMPPVLMYSYDPSRCPGLYSGLGLGWAEEALKEARAAHNKGGGDGASGGVGVGVLGGEVGGEV